MGTCVCVNAGAREAQGIRSPAAGVQVVVSSLMLMLGTDLCPSVPLQGQCQLLTAESAFQPTLY